MITSQGMLVCSFNLKQRFSRGEENVYPLNQQYELKLENETLRIEDAAKFFQIFCQENSKFTDDTIKMKLFSVKENSFCKIVRDTSLFPEPNRRLRKRLPCRERSGSGPDNRPRISRRRIRR